MAKNPEFTVTNDPRTSTLSEEYVKAVYEKYGAFSELTETIPDDELDDLEYYGRYGWSRTAPVCTDDDCPCED